MSVQDGDLWRFCLRYYQRPGVEQACLTLQDDYEADVNMLLFALWSAELGALVSIEQTLLAEASCKAWREAVVLPLRQVRRILKQSSLGADPETASKIRLAVKSMELDAERAQLQILERCKATPVTGTTRSVLASENLRHVLALRHHQPPPALIAVLLQALETA